MFLSIFVLFSNAGENRGEFELLVFPAVVL